MISSLIDELVLRLTQQQNDTIDKSQLKALLESGLAKLDLVPRAEFDAQQAVLARTREKLDALEKTLDELNKKITMTEANNN